MVSDKAADHRDAASRHEVAAESHERAAKFWEGQGDSERAGLQREMAEYERHDGELERRWAEPVHRDTAPSEVRAAEHVVAHARQGAKTASSILMQLSPSPRSPCFDRRRTGALNG